MKIAVLISRILLGLVFVVFGLNGFLNFIPAGPLPPGLAGQFVSVLLQSHYVWFVSAFELVPGVLLLANRYIPLAVALLAPMLVNILLYHFLLDMTGLPIALIVVLLWGIIAFRNRKYFYPLLVQQTS